MSKYNIIYADPPWRYQDKGCQGAAEDQYPTMSETELALLPIKSLCAEDCIIFLWATYPKLPEAIQTMKNWGFLYKSVAFTWIKTTKNSIKPFYGLGHWTRGNPEICLLGTKGKPKRVSKGVQNLQYGNLNGHSHKPAKFRDLIVKLCGDLPRIELFARQKTPGWDVWGNEVKSDIILGDTIG